MVKLPFWRTVGNAYQFPFTQPLAALRALWLLFGLTLACSLWLATVSAPTPSAILIAALVGIVIFVPTWTAAQVALHRSVLLDESSWGAALRFGRRHWSFLGKAFLLVLFACLPVAASAVIVRGFGIAAFFVLLVIGVPLIIVVGLFTSRLVLALPATAADGSDRSLRGAWRLSRRNAWRIWGGTILCYLPFSIILKLINALLPTSNPILIGGRVMTRMSPTGSVLWVITFFIYLAVIFAFYSLAYQRLAENGTTSAPGNT